MDGKITLITPPDFYENNNVSILFFHLSDEEQENISRWLNESKIQYDINLYVYTNENSLPWIFYAFGRCDYKYINFDQMNSVTQALGGYLLSRNDVYYKTKNENLSAIYSHINNNRIDRVETFLESVLVGQGN
jgi:hypothetical protein